ncbi:MAG: hypothetical protein ACRD1J_04335 [Terriglobia bacterium]
MAKQHPPFLRVTPMKRLKSLLGLTVMSLGVISCWPVKARAGPDNEAAEIAALKRRVAEQDRRISELEREVQQLMGAVHKTASPASAVQSPPHKAAEAVRVPPAAPQPLVSAKNTPKGPKIQIAGINVGGDVYLYQYIPSGVPGAQPKFELYAFSVLLDAQHGHWGFHSDYRLRTTKLRSFFPGNTWLQEGYIRYETSYGEFRAGSFYRRVGLAWDGSFFGNIQYFDGLKLDPEFGVGFQGAHDFSSRLGAHYSAQYFSTDARINGSLPGRDFVSEPGAHAKNDVTARFAPVLHFSPSVSLTVGGSAAHGAIDRDSGPNNIRDQLALDATLQTGPLLTYAEVLRQNVHGAVVLPPQNATYALAGIRWARGRFQPRFNFSQGNYFGLNPRREYILQPGITVEMVDGFYFIYEYDFWRAAAISSSQVLDRSQNLVLQYHF